MRTNSPNQESLGTLGIFNHVRRLGEETTYMPDVKPREVRQ